MYRKIHKSKDRNLYALNLWDNNIKNAIESSKEEDSFYFLWDISEEADIEEFEIDKKDYMYIKYIANDDGEFFEEVV